MAAQAELRRSQRGAPLHALQSRLLLRRAAAGAAYRLCMSVAPGAERTSSTEQRPLPMMPKFCADATAIRLSTKGLNLTE